MFYIFATKFRDMARYIYQNKDWTNFTWDNNVINQLLGEVRYLQGKIYGQIHLLGFSIQEETKLSTLTLDIIKSSEIEGNNLDYDQVRSSVARHLGLEIGGLTPINRNIEGVVEMVLDATQNYLQPITEERLFGWHSCLFPSGRSGMYKIEVGKYRSEEMQIVSGAMGFEKVHYEAVPVQLVQIEMAKFIDWLNQDTPLDFVIKSAIAHFWFIIIHPFDDGNGRIARAISDLFLSRADKTANRFYSMSNQMLIEKKQYYDVLQKVQHSDGDITLWIEWFLNCLKNTLTETENSLSRIVYKAEFWKWHENIPFNKRQRLVLNKLLDRFEGKLKSSKWAKIAKCSSDTALRDIKDLIEKGILKQESEGGRSTNYELIDFSSNH